MDVVGIDDIDDELVGIEGVRGELEEELYEHEEGDLYDEDDEYVGTEDVFRSVEDGVPYIPPTSPTFQEPAEDRKSKKKKKKR